MEEAIQVLLQEAGQKVSNSLSNMSDQHQQALSHQKHILDQTVCNSIIQAAISDGNKHSSCKIRPRMLSVWEGVERLRQIRQ